MGSRSASSTMALYFRKRKGCSFGLPVPIRSQTLKFRRPSIWSSPTLVLVRRTAVRVISSGSAKTEEEIEASQQLRIKLTKGNTKKKVFFWNNRNARRKQSGTLIWWFKEWLDKVGHDKAMLLMHTDPKDPHGQDLPHLIDKLKLHNGQVLLSTQKVSPKDLASIYRTADYTINISDAEGFGLATLESLSCGTPIIVNMTGGLQEQVTDGKNFFGFAIHPCSKTVIGSLQVPYIYEDRISQRDFDKALTKALKNPVKKYKQMASQGQRHILKNYNFENFENA